MPNMEELLNQTSVELTRDRTVQLFISKTDLNYACGQTKLSEKQADNAFSQLSEGNSADTIDFNLKRGFYGLADTPTIFQEIN